MKVFIVGRRAAHTSRRFAHNHLRTVHGPLVVNAPPEAAPLPSPYVQNHVWDGVYPTDTQSLPGEIDLVTEINFADQDQMRAALATDYYRDTLAPDEPNFVDTAGVARLPVAASQDVTGMSGPCKLIVLVLAGAHNAAIAELLVHRALGRRHRLHRLVPGAGPFSALLEGWSATYDDALAWGEGMSRLGAIVLAAEEVTADIIRAEAGMTFAAKF